MTTIKTIVEFEGHEDGFLPWDFALDAAHTLVGKHPYAGAKVVGFAPKGDTQAMLVFTALDGWEEQVVGLVPVLAEEGAWYQLPSHVVRRVRPFGVKGAEQA